jgi:hypothetical protein
MKGLSVTKFKNLHYETQLLESLSWDEDQLKALFDYIDLIFTSDILISPNEVLSTIEEYFGNDTRICFEKIFNEIAITNNLHITESENEH